LYFSLAVEKENSQYVASRNGREGIGDEIENKWHVQTRFYTTKVCTTITLLHNGLLIFISAGAAIELH
jgi:hypothetical protein